MQNKKAQQILIWSNLSWAFCRYKNDWNMIYILKPIWRFGFNRCKTDYSFYSILMTTRTNIFIACVSCCRYIKLYNWKIIYILTGFCSYQTFGKRLLFVITLQMLYCSAKYINFYKNFPMLIYIGVDMPFSFKINRWNRDKCYKDCKKKTV